MSPRSLRSAAAARGSPDPCRTVTAAAKVAVSSTASMRTSPVRPGMASSSRNGCPTTDLMGYSATLDSSNVVKLSNASTAPLRPVRGSQASRASSQRDHDLRHGRRSPIGARQDRAERLGCDPAAPGVSPDRRQEDACSPHHAGRPRPSASGAPSGEPSKNTMSRTRGASRVDDGEGAERMIAAAKSPTRLWQRGTRGTQRDGRGAEDERRQPHQDGAVAAPLERARRRARRAAEGCSSREDVCQRHEPCPSTIEYV